MQILQIINTPEQDHNLNWQVYWTTEQDNKVSVHSASYRSREDAILKITTLNKLKNNTMEKQDLINKYTDAMLDIINNLDDFTTSDLQGAISAQISMLINETLNNNQYE